MGNPFALYPDANTRGLPSLAFTQVPVLENLGNPTQCWGLFDDFVIGPEHASTGVTIPGWVVSEITDGQITPANELGGALNLITSGTEDQGIQAQTSESFQPDVPYRIAFGARVKLVDADQSDIFIGLCTADTDVAQSIPNDAIGFNIADASANILYYCQKDGTGAAGTDTTSDAVDATYVTLEAVIEGEKEVKFYVDNVLKATYSTEANIPDDEQLAFTIANVTGEGSTNALTVDWAYCYQWVK